jgi:hypothetical protein
MMSGKSRAEIQAEADRRNAEAPPTGIYQHWYVHEDGYGPCLTCRWERIPLTLRAKMWLVEKLGGDPERMI